MNRELYNNLMKSESIYQEIETLEKSLSRCKKELNIYEKRAERDDLSDEYSNVEEEANDRIKGGTITKIPLIISAVLLIIQIVVMRFFLFDESVKTIDPEYSSMIKTISVIYVITAVYYACNRLVNYIINYTRIKKDPLKKPEKMQLPFIHPAFLVASIGSLIWGEEFVPFVDIDIKFKIIFAITAASHIGSLICSAIYCRKFRKKEKEQLLEKARLEIESLKQEEDMRVKEAQKEYNKVAPSYNEEISSYRQKISSLRQKAVQILGPSSENLNFETVKRLIGYYDTFFVEMRREPNDLDDLLTFVNVKDSQFKAKLEFDAWQNKMEAERRAEEERARIMRDLDATFARNKLSKEIDNLRRDIDKLSR